MDYKQAVDYIHSVSWLGSKPGLSRVVELLELLGDPQDKLMVVHVAGTNGKGSVSAMIERVLRHSGLKTGLYTSPFIVDFNERIRIDGASIEDGAFADVVAQIKPLAARMDESPTEFELLTAAAFLYFYEQRCEVVVLETGMGGRLDATNVVKQPLCSVITPVSLDHTEYLGATIEQIASEKAGIIKTGRPVVSLQEDARAAAVVEKAAHLHGARLTEPNAAAIEEKEYGDTEQSFYYKGEGPYALGLLGRHQLRNAAVALEVFEVLRAEGYSIPMPDVAAGLRETHWPARFQIVERAPLFVLDGAHNLAGARVAVDAFARHFPGERAVVLFGVLADKDWRDMAAMFNEKARAFVAFAPQNARALDSAELADYLKSEFQKPAFCEKDAAAAIEKARELAGGGAVLAVGSLYAAGEILQAFGRHYGQI